MFACTDPSIFSRVNDLSDSGDFILFQMNLDRAIENQRCTFLAEGEAVNLRDDKMFPSLIQIQRTSDGGTYWTSSLWAR